MAQLMDLSIIISVYQVEKYIHTCMESIFRQGLSDDRFEVIIINDGTKDKSMEAISDIVSQHSNITIINQGNQGLSVARNNGIAAAKGEYLLMPDPDDLLIENSLPILLEKALETKVDLVVADFLEMNDEEIDGLHGKMPAQPAFKMREKSGAELFLEDLNPYQCYVWRTLFRRAFILDQKLSFVPGVRFQDVPFTHECYLKAHRCLRVSTLLNIYRKGRVGAATAAFSLKKAHDYCIVIGKTWQLTHIQGLQPEVVKKIKDDVYISFSILLYSTLYSIKSFSDQLQILNDLNDKVPDLYFTSDILQRLESYLFKSCPSFYLRVRRWHCKWQHRH